MREIKFRAWSPIKKRMESVGDIEWVEYEGSKIDSLCTETQKLHPSNFILMQYTGLKDKSGKEIYEGDIVKFDKIISKIVWEKYSLWLHHLNTAITSDPASGRMPFRWAEQYEIIGNIYENPELL